MSTWISLYGRFDLTPANGPFEEYEKAVKRWAEFNNVWKDDDEVVLPGQTALLRCLTWDCYEHLDETHNDYGLDRYPLGVTKRGVQTVLIPPTPYGSEGMLDLKVYSECTEGVYDDPSDADIFSNQMTHHVLVHGGLRDRGTEDLPYIRMWWCVLGLAFGSMDSGIMTVSHAGGDEVWLASDLYSLKGTKYYYGKMFKLFQGIMAAYYADVPREMDFQRWYNWKYVPEHGDEFLKLMDKLGWRIEIKKPKEEEPNEE